MAIHSLNSLEMPSLASAFSSVLPDVICGQPAGRECATNLANNCRGARTYEQRGQPNEESELELELIQTQMTQKPMLRAEAVTFIHYN